VHIHSLFIYLHQRMSETWNSIPLHCFLLVILGPFSLTPSLWEFGWESQWRVDGCMCLLSFLSLSLSLSWWKNGTYYHFCFFFCCSTSTSFHHHEERRPKLKNLHNTTTLCIHTCPQIYTFIHIERLLQLCLSFIIWSGPQSSSSSYMLSCLT